MMYSIGIKEIATEKVMQVEPTNLGVRVFIKNFALDTREHIELDLDDMKVVVQVLNIRIKQLEMEDDKE